MVTRRELKFAKAGAPSPTREGACAPQRSAIGGQRSVATATSFGGEEDGGQTIMIRSGTLFVLKAPPDPRRVSTAVQNRSDAHDVCLDAIVDSERETPTEAAMISENLRMNATVKRQGVDVSE